MSDINYLAEIKIASLTSHDTCGSLEQRAPDLVNSPGRGPWLLHTYISDPQMYDP